MWKLACHIRPESGGKLCDYSRKALVSHCFFTYRNLLNENGLDNFIRIIKIVGNINMTETTLLRYYGNNEL